MANLTDIIASAKSQIKTSTSTSSNTVTATARGAINTVSQDLASAPSRALQQIVTPVTTGVNAAIGAGLSDVRAATDQLIHGNISGALHTLGGAGQSSLAALTKAFGIGSGSKLTGPSKSLNTVAEGNSLGGALARPDPMLGFNWYAVLPDVTPIEGTPQKLPWYYVEEANPAFRMFETRSIFHEGHNKHYPSTYTVDPLSMAIYADENNEALNYLTSWAGAILLPTTTSTVETQGGGYGRPAGYKKTIKIILVNAAKKKIATLTYIGCWPTHMDPYALESSSSTRLVNRVTFSVDDVFITLDSFTPMETGAPNVWGTNKFPLGQ